MNDSSLENTIAHHNTSKSQEPLLPHQPGQAKSPI